MNEYRIEFSESCAVRSIIIRAFSLSLAITQCEISLCKYYKHCIISIHKIN